MRLVVVTLDPLRAGPVMGSRQVAVVGIGGGIRRTFCFLRYFFIFSFAMEWLSDEKRKRGTGSKDG